MIKNMTTTEKQLTEIEIKPSVSENTIMEAIALLEPIPDSLWICGAYNMGGKTHCGGGHLMSLDHELWKNLEKIYRKYGVCFESLNDAVCMAWLTSELNMLPTPKQRTLAGLRLLLQKELEK